MNKIAATLLALALAVAVAGCGSSTGPTSPRPGSDTVTVQTDDGKVTVPVTDQGIWALDYQTALNLLSIGVVADHAGRYTYATDPFVKASYDLLEEAGVTLVEPGKIEKVAEAAPRLIIGHGSTGNDEILKQAKRIAPVVQLSDLPDLDSEMRTLGAVTGNVDQATALLDRLADDRADLAARVARAVPAQTEVSVLSACGAQSFCAYGNARGFGPVLTDLGLQRPAPQSASGNAWGYAIVSAEQLESQSADVVIALGGSVARGEPSPLSSPLLRTSGSRTGEVDFSAWFGVGPLNHVWVLHDLKAILSGDGRTANAQDGPELWRQHVVEPDQ